MSEQVSPFAIALQLLFSLDADLFEIVFLSLRVSLTAVFIGCLIGLPLGAAVASLRFPGRSALTIFLNTMMGLPPVVVGLLVYMMLSRTGPLGVLGLLYSPTAMIIAQSLLVTPLIAALSRQLLSELFAEYEELFSSLSLSRTRILGALLWDGRYGLLTVGLAGFGRASAEVGAVMIVGGNINHVTRLMTTAIALETSKGELALALGLGIILVMIAIVINTAVTLLRGTARTFAYA